MNGTDPIAYLFRGETFCPVCIHDLFVPYELADDPRHSTEEILDRVARDRGINRHDEKTFRSREFPQPLYVADVTSADVCFFCGMRLLEETT
jgi:hypothetical protein